MSYVTQIPDAEFEMNAATGKPALAITDQLLLNELSNSQSFDKYDVNDSSATNLVRNDDMDLVMSSGEMVKTGTYMGTGSLSTTAADIGLPPLLGVTVQVNPISGQMMAGSDGNTYFITDQPLDQDHIGLKISGKVAGLSVDFMDISISDALTNPLLSSIADDLQVLLDTVTVNMGYNEAGVTALGEQEVFTCFSRGTLIKTPEGCVAIEKLKAGDLVLTRDNGAKAIRWIGSRIINAQTLERNPSIRPIRISAGALGNNTPSKDLLVSPQHRILLRSRIATRMFATDEVLVAAKQLLLADGVNIAYDLDEVEYFHILFDQHEVVYSDGAETESLYTGPQALKSIGVSARNEIFAIFPELRLKDYMPVSAREIPSGRKARTLASRHIRNNQAFVM